MFNYGWLWLIIVNVDTNNHGLFSIQSQWIIFGGAGLNSHDVWSLKVGEERIAAICWSEITAFSTTTSLDFGVFAWGDNRFMTAWCIWLQTTTITPCHYVTQAHCPKIPFWRWLLTLTDASVSWELVTRASHAVHSLRSLLVGSWDSFLAVPRQSVQQHDIFLPAICQQTFVPESSVALKEAATSLLPTPCFDNLKHGSYQKMNPKNIATC